MRELNLDQLRTLVAVADLGTFTAAAQALHLAQPTVSLHIAELESRLGTPLLARGLRQARPTPAGALLVERARRLLRDAGDAVDAVQRHAAGLAGRVRLGTTTNIAVYLLPQVMEALRARHPGIEVELHVLGSHDAVAWLAEGRLDIGLVSPPEAAPDLVVQPWRRDPMMAFVPAGWTVPRRATPAWLATQPLILNEPTTRMYRQTMAWFAAAGLAPRARIALNYMEAIKTMVAAGYGAAVLPLETPEAARTQLGIRVLPLRPALVRPTALVHRALPLLDGAARHFLAALAQFRQAAPRATGTPAAGA